jgi:hypothetical protein
MGSRPKTLGREGHGALPSPVTLEELGIGVHKRFSRKRSDFS